MKRTVLIFAIMLLSHYSIAQKFAVSVGTDAISIGSFDAEVQYSVSRHFTLDAKAKFNPWRYNNAPQWLLSRQQTYSFGARWWPWYIYSGWWLAASAQYQEYGRGHSFSASNDYEEGDAVGLALSGGYTFIINSWFNIELGIGAWAGYTWYKTYVCPTCGVRTDADAKAPPSQKVFILPNELTLSFAFNF